MDKSAAIFGYVAVAALLGVGGYIAWDRSQSGSVCATGAVGGDIGGPFTLVDTTGTTVTETDVITRPSLIYFGYTYCPDVCPFDNARNAQAIDILEEQGIAATPIFITIDPQRDTPDVLAEYTANMHPAMIGLTGTDAQIKAAADAYRVLYQRREIEGGDYLMDHSVLTYLVLPETGFVDFFRREATPEDIASSVACFTGA
jgi:protein SCO1